MPSGTSSYLKHWYGPGHRLRQGQLVKNRPRLRIVDRVETIHGVGQVRPQRLSGNVFDDSKLLNYHVIEVRADQCQQRIALIRP